MGYVADRMRDRAISASSEGARERRQRYACLRAHDAEGWEGRFHMAYGWLGTALVYSRRRGYPSAAHRERAHARRLQITSLAGAAVQEAANAVDGAFSEHRSSWERRQELRGAYYKAPETRSLDERPWRLDAARGWLMLGMKQARRCADRRSSPEVLAEVSRIVNEVTDKLIAWAEEMDADDYGQ